jgi:HEAT repeat protein
MPALAPLIGKLLKSSNERDQVMAARALRAMGPAGSSQAPLLIDFIRQQRSWDATWAAGQALGKMPAALPALLPLLDDPSPRVRSGVLQALGEMGAAASAHAPRVATFLDDGDSSIRREAITALGKMGPAAAEHAPRIGPRVKDSDWLARHAAVEALGRMGPAAAAQAPLLGESLKSQERRLVLAAVQALGKLGPAAAASQAPLLVDVLKAHPRDDELMRATVELLQGMPVAAPLLAPLLRYPEAMVPVHAAAALGGLGAAAREQVPLLGELLREGNLPVAVPALAALGEVAREQAPLLARALEKDPSSLYRAGMAQALGNMGAREYAPLLVTPLGCPSGLRAFDMRELEEALLRLAPLDSPSVALLLTKLLTDATPCRAGVLAFAHLVGGGDPQVERLLTWVARPDEQLPTRLTLDEARETLRAFAELWPLTEASPLLKADVAGRIARVARLARGQWGEADRELLDMHEQRLREDYPEHADAVAAARGT